MIENRTIFGYFFSIPVSYVFDFAHVESYNFSAIFQSGLTVLELKDGTFEPDIRPKCAILISQVIIKLQWKPVTLKLKAIKMAQRE